MCPAPDLLLPIAVSMGDIKAQLGEVSTFNGQTTFAGTLTAAWSFGNLNVPFAPGFTTYYVATLDSAKVPLAAVTVSALSGSNSALTHVVATADGGSAVAFTGVGIGVTDDPIPSNQDQGFQDVLIIKLSSSGTLEWSLLLEGVSGDLLVDTLQATPDGLLIGGTHIEADIVFTHQPAGTMVDAANIITPPGLFLLEVGLDGSGLPQNAQLFPGLGRIMAVRDHAGRRFVFGGYQGPFPNFGGSIPVDSSPQQALFVVELDGNQVVSQKPFGFDNRFNTPVGMVDTGDGLVMFGTTGSDASFQAPFRGHPMTTIPVGNHAGFVAKIDYASAVQWVETDIIDLGGGTSLHSPGLTNQGGLVYGYRLGATGSRVSVGMDSFIEPQHDTVFVRRDLNGALRGVLPATTPTASTRVDLALRSGPCGALVVGSFNEDAYLDDHFYNGNGGQIDAVVDLFPQGLPFPAP